MKVIDVALVVSLLGAAAAGTYALTRPDPPARRRPARPEVRRALVPEWSPVEVSAGEGAAGRVRFAVEDGAKVTGIALATFFREGPDGSILPQGVEVHERQFGDELRLGDWVTHAKSGGVRLLRYVLWIEKDGVRESRGGWARCEGSDLVGGDLLVRAPRRTTTEVRVKTAAGDPVPGALVTVDAAPLGSGPMSHPALTDASGRAVFSGLEADRAWVARVPGGVGPLSAELDQNFASGADVVVLVAPLAGAWTFHAYPVHPAFQGQTLAIDDVDQPGRPGTVVWPVARLLLPGLAPHAKVHVLHRRDAPVGAEVRLRLRGYEPVLFPLSGLTEPISLVAAAPPRPAIPGTARRGAQASSPPSSAPAAAPR